MVLLIIVVTEILAALQHYLRLRGWASKEFLLQDVYKQSINYAITFANAARHEVRDLT